MSNTLLSPLPSLRLSDDDIPPATATLCRWHPQPRPRPPKPRCFSTPARGPRHARQPKSPPPLPIQASSSVRERPTRAEPRLKSPETDTAAGAYSPRGFLLRGFSDACLRVAPRAVTGRHPKTLNDSGRSWDRDRAARFDPKRSFGRVGETDGRLPLSRHSSPPVAAQGVPTAVIRNPHKGVCVTAFSILGEVPQILRLTQVRDRAPAAGTLETIALFE